MFSLNDKVAIVTGAGSGIGASIAEAFVRSGALVYVADVDGTAAAAVAERLGGRALPAVLDVAQEEECVGLVERVMSEHGRCEVLVNNAGIGHVGTILNTEPADLDRLWRVNFCGAYHLSRAVLPGMIAAGRGSIIHISSIAGITGMEARFAYTVTKHALVGMTRAMAMDHGTTGVRINAICPGRVETPFVEARLREYADPEEYRRQLSAPHAVKRMAQPCEIAAAAVFLASDEASFVTGSTMTVDGGYTAGK